MAGSSLRCAISAPGLQIRKGLSSHSIVRRRMEWASACPSVARSFRRTKANCGPETTRRKERSLPLPCWRREVSKVAQQSETVFVVDDDFRVREALADLFASRNLNCITFASAAEYLRSAKPDGPSCLVLDVSLPDINGLDLQSSLTGDVHPPIVFISGHGDVPSSVRAMKARAIDFLTKPWSDEDLLQAVRTAIERDRQQRRNAAEMIELEERLAALTPREREVLPLVARGLMNKQAAAQLGISEVTLQIHRGKIMQKMRAASLADLVRMAAKLDIP